MGTAEESMPGQADGEFKSSGWRNWLYVAMEWVDKRTGVREPIIRVLNYPVSTHVQKNLFYAVGGLTLTSILLQMISGLTMAFYYSPSIESAYASVDFITYLVPAGWLVRGIHVYNASILFILLFFHLLRTFFTSAYKKPREISWLTGVLLLLITVGFAFTGTLLPWDQHGYWATIVGTEIAGSTPLVGNWILRLMRGGTILGQVTLTRFYVTHTIILPLTLIILIGVHISQLYRHGAAPPMTKQGQLLSQKTVPFYPNRLFVHAILGLCLLLLLIFLSWRQRAPLEFLADPSSTNYTPRPDWYFLSLFQLLHYFPGRLEVIASLIIPSLLFGSLFLLPFIDRSEERRPWKKPITTSLGIFIIVMILILTVIALNTPG